MAQASLTPGPGTFVEDALAPVLADGTNIDATAAQGWVAVDRPWDCVVVLEPGTIAGTSGTVDVEIQAADDDSGTNAVTLGSFAQLDQDDDGVERILVVSTHKPYMQAVVTIGGDAETPAVITVRDKTYHQADDRTA